MLFRSVKNKYQELKINFYSLEEKYNKDCLHYTATKNLYKNSSPPKKPKELNSFPEEEDGAFELLKNETNLLSELIEKYKAQTLENKNEITAPLKNGVKKKKLEIKTNNKVFIVHGHDKEMELDVARFVEKLGLKAVILHEETSGGDTIIEKIEKHTDVGYGIVLYSPCDKGKGKAEKTLKNRARQNVVFEHGYLMGKLGRDRVIALNKNNVEVPSDITGIVYVPFDNHCGWQMTIAKEMKNKGFEIDLNRL